MSLLYRISFKNTTEIDCNIEQNFRCQLQSAGSPLKSMSSTLQYIKSYRKVAKVDNTLQVLRVNLVTSTMWNEFLLYFY